MSDTTKHFLTVLWNVVIGAALLVGAAGAIFGWGIAAIYIAALLPGGQSSNEIGIGNTFVPVLHWLGVYMVPNIIGLCYCLGRYARRGQ